MFDPIETNDGNVILTEAAGAGGNTPGHQYAVKGNEVIAESKDEDEEAQSQQPLKEAEETENANAAMFENQMFLLKSSDITQKSHSVKVLDHKVNKSQLTTTQTPIIEEEKAKPDFHFEELAHQSQQREHRPSNVGFYDESNDSTVFGETSMQQDERVRRASPFGTLKTWRLLKIIVKSNDDVRQEQFAMQLISQLD